jgi:hypothetical protein
LLLETASTAGKIAAWTLQSCALIKIFVKRETAG